MKWVFAGLALVTLGWILRRLLRLDEEPRSPVGLLRLSPEREVIYQLLAPEIETHAAMVGVSLNEAFEERHQGHHENAWRLARLAAAEWSRLGEIVNILLVSMNDRLPVARDLVSLRGIASQRFKSQLMIDYVRMHELLDQLIYRSKFRFQVHLRVLRRAVETLTVELEQAFQSIEQTGFLANEELWNEIDLYFHDLDLLAKETLLTLRAFLPCLPTPILESFSAGLRLAVRNSVRSAPVRVDT